MGTHLLKNDDQVGLCDRRCFAAGQHVSRRVPVQEGLFLFQRGCRSTPGSYVARMCYCVCCARRAGGCGGGWTLASDAAEHAVVGDCACVSGCCCWFWGQRKSGGTLWATCSVLRLRWPRRTRMRALSRRSSRSILDTIRRLLHGTRPSSRRRGRRLLRLGSTPFPTSR